VQKYVIFLISILQLRKNISSPIPPSHICQIAQGGRKLGVYLIVGIIGEVTQTTGEEVLVAT
jgi:hypothetical protein